MAEAENWVKEIQIDLDACKGCKSCVNACFTDVCVNIRMAKFN